MSKIIVIGGGASGLVSAIKASSKNDVTILEKNNICGKKILVTGNGRCNYFNDDFNISHYHSNDINELNKIINLENKNKVLDFFNSIGVVPKVKDGYYYPFSNQASTIQNVLLLEAKKRNARIINDVEVSEIEYIDNKFIITTNKGNYYADKVIIATGSKACPKTGSTGIGYKLVSKFNHSIIDVLPALVQLRGSDNYYKDWAGIRTDVKVSLYENDEQLVSEFGEIQLTNYGISGICVFQLSSLIARGLKFNKKEEVKINFLPYLDNLSSDEIYNYFDDRDKLLKKPSVINLLEGMLNYKLIKVILKKIFIKEDTLYSELSSNDKVKLIKSLTEFSFIVKETNSFDNAQVCSGGVPLSEINIDTMESLKQKDLYIVGELLDVDGNCGGYNLAFAWLSGIIAGENI